jgi:hypothetical protein
MGYISKRRNKSSITIFKQLYQKKKSNFSKFTKQKKNFKQKHKHSNVFHFENSYKAKLIKRKKHWNKLRERNRNIFNKNNELKSE